MRYFASKFAFSLGRDADQKNLPGKNLDYGKSGREILAWVNNKINV